METPGCLSDVIMVSGRSSGAYSAAQIRDYVMSLEADADEHIVLLGYSKGAPDALEAVVQYLELQLLVAPE